MPEATLYAFVAFLVILDPPGTAAIFAAMTAGDTAAEKREQAIRATVISFLVLIGFAVAGGFLLRALGIGLPSLKVAGGLLLFLAAADMVMGSTLLRATPAEQEAARRTKEDISVFPLAIPLIAGPGAMTTIVLLSEQAAGDWLRLAGVLLAMSAALGITLAAMLGAAQVTRLLGETGQHVIGRVLGVVLAALAAEIALDGIRESFAG
jgi:multiple antibiotic resistance protein